MPPGGSAHGVGARRFGGLDSSVGGRGRCGLSVFTPFAAKTVSTVSSALASTDVSLISACPGLPPLLGGQKIGCNPDRTMTAEQLEDCLGWQLWKEIDHALLQDYLPTWVFYFFPPLIQ
jgi:hypothetical protein